MKSCKLFLKWLTGGCVYFTVLSLFIILVNLLITDGASSKGISLTAFLLFFPCGLCISAGGLLLRIKSIPRWGRYLLHYLISVLALFLMLYLPASANSGSMFKLLTFILMSVIYWVLFGLVMLIYSRVRRLLAEDD